MNFGNRTIGMALFVVSGFFVASSELRLEAATLAVQADAYIQGTPTGAATNFGASNPLQVKYNDTTDFHRKAYFRFNAGGPQDYASASLNFTVATHAATATPSKSWTFSVYGLLDGNAGNSWIESGPGSITWNTAPANVAAGNAVNTAQVFNGAALATFNVIDGGVASSTVTLDSTTFPDLLDFLNADTDGLMSFILLRNTQAIGAPQNVVHQFVSREGNPNATTLTFLLTPEPASLVMWSTAAMALCATLGWRTRRRFRSR